MATTETPRSTVAPQVSASAIVASPDPYFREQLLGAARALNWAADESLGGAQALGRLESNRYQVVLLDHWLADLNVNEVVALVRELYPGVLVCVIDLSTSPPVVRIEPETHPYGGAVSRLIETVLPPEPGLRPGEPGAGFADAEPPQELEQPLADMIGSSPAMRDVYRMVRLVAPRLTTVLVVGGTGTGKELVAHAVHRLSLRSRQPFVTVNCAAIPEALLEAELFGYSRGAFTGAFQTRIGRLHAAHGGTLFLDEVGDLPLAMQAKLLRFLQDGEVQRLGSSEALRVDTRVVAATNVNLAERVQQKTFREDLYYRLSVFPIEVQPLQNRIEDILPLSIHFLTGFCREGRVPNKNVSPAAEAILSRHAWPGNVRELRHVIERAFILAGENPLILPEHVRVQSVFQPT